MGALFSVFLPAKLPLRISVFTGLVLEWGLREYYRSKKMGAHSHTTSSPIQPDKTNEHAERRLAPLIRLVSWPIVVSRLRAVNPPSLFPFHCYLLARTNARAGCFHSAAAAFHEGVWVQRDGRQTTEYDLHMTILPSHSFPDPARCTFVVCVCGISLGQKYSVLVFCSTPLLGCASVQNCLAWGWLRWSQRCTGFVVRRIVKVLCVCMFLSSPMS